MMNPTPRLRLAPEPVPGDDDPLWLALHKDEAFLLHSYVEDVPDLKPIAERLWAMIRLDPLRLIDGGPWNVQ